MPRIIISLSSSVIDPEIMGKFGSGTVPTIAEHLRSISS
jgi:hypothetical protein